MYEIIPSPGTENKSFDEVEKKIRSVQSFARTIHIDVCDGIFAPNKTFADPEPFKEFIKQMATERSGWVTEDKGILFEVHLMVEEPINYLQKWADVGFTRFIGQVEKMSSQEEFIAKAQLLGEVGLAIDGPTPLDALKANYDDLDVVLFYTGDKAGFSGGTFKEDRLEKIKALRKLEEYLPIEADGGINDETIAVAAESGLTRFVTTGFLFNLETPVKQFKLLEQKLQELEEAEKEVQAA
jgi:ribulose-phosphate 3-epimerase